MALEEELSTRIKQHCSRVFTPAAPFSTTRPYVTWQHVGGDAIRFMDNSAPSQRMAFIQVNTWATSKKGAFDLLRNIEEELCKVTDGAFIARTMEEPSDAYIQGVEEQEPSADGYGALQTFRVWGLRFDPPAPPAPPAPAPPPGP